ncbi:MAG: YcnI family protein [Acetobacteraceae bacterium]|nr:YcnI family protein [Acetobacteraceae bacterium]
MRLPLSLAAAGILLAIPAQAHVTLDPASAPAGSFVRAALRVPHGCNGAATTRIAVEIPEGIYTAKPMPKPGWRLTIERRPPQAAHAAHAAHGHHEEEEVARIIWEGGRLPDDQYDEFVLMLQVPNEPGGTLFLPVTQGCEGGRSDAWAERPAPGQQAHDLAHPAPAMRLNPR